MLPLYPSPDDAIALFFTSGSTSVPKSVKRTDGQLMRVIRNRIRSVRTQADDRFFVAAPPAVAGPALHCLSSLGVGGQYGFIEALASSDEIVSMMSRFRPTVLHCSIALLRVLLQQSDIETATASTWLVRLTGDIVEWRDIRAAYAVLPDDAMMNCNYASTEGSQLSDWFVPRDMADRDGWVPLGYPTPGSELCIDRSIAGEGENDVVGEAIAAGERLASGYWNDPETTARTFGEHPLEAGKRIYRTGDLVRFEEDGLLHFLGRADDQIKLHGWRIELEEFEGAARNAPGVVHADVAPCRDTEEKVRQLVMHVAGTDGDAPDPDSVLAHLREVLPAYMVPSDIVAVGTGFDDTERHDRSHAARGVGSTGRGGQGSNQDRVG